MSTTNITSPTPEELEAERIKAAAAKAKQRTEDLEALLPEVERDAAESRQRVNEQEAAVAAVEAKFKQVCDDELNAPLPTNLEGFADVYSRLATALNEYQVAAARLGVHPWTQRSVINAHPIQALMPWLGLFRRER